MMSEKWSVEIKRMSGKSKRKKKDNKQKDIANKKGNRKEGKEEIKKEDAMSKKNEAPQKEDIDTNITEQTIKRWADKLLKYVPLLTFLSSIYIACMSWAIERYLQKYNIGYVNVQFPSKAQMINGILAACATMLIALWFAPYYQTLTKQGKKGPDSKIHNLCSRLYDFVYWCVLKCRILNFKRLGDSRHWKRIHIIHSRTKQYFCYVHMRILARYSNGVL